MSECVWREQSSSVLQDARRHSSKESHSQRITAMVSVVSAVCVCSSAGRLIRSPAHQISILKLKEKGREKGQSHWADLQSKHCHTCVCVSECCTLESWGVCSPNEFLLSPLMPGPNSAMAAASAAAAVNGTDSDC